MLDKCLGKKISEGRGLGSARVWWRLQFYKGQAGEAYREFKGHTSNLNGFILQREFISSHKYNESIPRHSWMRCLKWRFLESVSFPLLTLISSPWLQHPAGCLLVTRWLLDLQLLTSEALGKRDMSSPMVPTNVLILSLAGLARITWTWEYANYPGLAGCLPWGGAGEVRSADSNPRYWGVGVGGFHQKEAHRDDMCQTGTYNKWTPSQPSSGEERPLTEAHQPSVLHESIKQP